jgi:pseudouridine-5'-phosphate glycosidase
MLQPPPARWALADAGELDRVIAEESAAAPRDRGPDVTPHLLQRLVDRTGGRTLLANIALLLSNARLAGEIATALAHGREPDRT